jgi:DNA-3-methyladenine glycosylase II
MIPTFTKRNLKRFYDQLGEADADLQNIIITYGYPPLWVRPNTFETLVLTILEQQVSLASAYAAYKRLKEKLKVVEPVTLLQLTDEELRACSFSRQKIGYVRGLAAAIVAGQINLQALARQPDEEVRHTLKSLKGIGDWTVDIYLLHALQRTDIFPLGDLALVNALKVVKGLSMQTAKEEMLQIAKPWRPYRSIATMLLWHYYIQKRGIILAY